MLLVQAHYRTVHFVNDGNRYQYQINPNAHCRQVAQRGVMVDGIRKRVQPCLLGAIDGLTTQHRTQPMCGEQYRAEKMGSAVQPRVAEHAKDPSAACADISTLILLR